MFKIQFYTHYMLLHRCICTCTYVPRPCRVPPSKNLKGNAQNLMFVNDVTEVEVKSADEAYEVLWRGQRKRTVAHTSLNAESSRSHSVFNIRLVSAPLDSHGEEVIKQLSGKCCRTVKNQRLKFGCTQYIRTRDLYVCTNVCTCIPLMSAGCSGQAAANGVAAVSG